MFFMIQNNTKDTLMIERLYNGYRRLMYQKAYNILGDSHLSEDAVHQSFLKIMNNLHKIDENDPPRTRGFLGIICENVAKDIYKKRLSLNINSEFIEEIPEDIVSINNDPVDIVIDNESVNRIRETIKNFKPIYRDVLLLKEYHDYTVDEIAELLDISAHATKKRLLRARAMLTQSLKKEEVL